MQHSDWDALALKHTQWIIATPNRPTKNTKNHLNAGTSTDQILISSLKMEQ